MHPDIEERLTAMSRHGDIPHLLFHGPHGSGKMTLVRHLLTKMYGPGANQLTTERRVVETTSPKHTIEMGVRMSNYHIEMEPSDAGANDKYVVQHAIKEMANNGSIAAVFMNLGVTHKTIVLTGAGNITKQAQAGLRRTMETFSSSCRLILVSTYCSTIIDPLRSRCVSVRVPLPSAEQLAGKLAEVVDDDPTLVDDIVKNSGRSISRAMFMAKVGNADKMVWVKYIESICTGVFLEQSPRKLLDVRESLNELLAAGVPASIVLKTLMHGLIDHPSLKGEDGVKRDIVKWAAVYEHRICVGSKDILHAEAFVATFMDLYKRHTVGMFK
ncbi:unnamed protein product [Ectocarpus sp. 12 AP-2014]